MSIKNSDITIVMQGGLNVGYDVRYAARYMRSIFPGIRIFLATQKKEVAGFDGGDDFDLIVTTSDPGPMPGLKFHDGGIHNIPRQMASSRAGMEKVQTTYALKLRTDAYLNSTKLLEYWNTWGDAPRGPNAKGRGRIIVNSFYTTKPYYDERFAYHVSDFLQFGYTEDLLRLWSCPPYDFETATWYERNPYREGSLPREREHRSRLSSEQWLTVHYLYGTGPHPIRFTNDISPEIIERYEDDLVDNFVVVHPFDINLTMPKFGGTFNNTYFNTLCYSHEDWKALAAKKRGLEGPTSGFTKWPLTERDIKRFMFMRTDPRMQRLMKYYPGRKGRDLRHLYYSWD